jgi:hypothetical protein
MSDKNQPDVTKCWFLTQHVSSISMPIFRSTIVIRVTSSVQHTHLTALRYTTQTAYRFGHQKVVLTIVLLKMGILLLETC